jgi:hypothetical protein
VRGWASGLPPQSPLQVADPRMPALQMDGIRRLRKSWIGERIRGNCSRCCRCASGRRGSGRAILFGVHPRRPPEGFRRNKMLFLSWASLCLIEGLRASVLLAHSGHQMHAGSRPRAGLTPSDRKNVLVMFLSSKELSANLRMPPGELGVQAYVDSKCSVCINTHHEEPRNYRGSSEGWVGPSGSKG